MPVVFFARLARRLHCCRKCCHGLSRCAASHDVAAGVSVGPLTVGGYANPVAALPANGSDRVALDGWSLLDSGHGSRNANRLLDAEIAHPVFVSEQGDRSSGVIQIGCLYNEFRIAPVRTLHAGKILAAVGEWSSIHVAPVVARKGLIRLIYQSGIATAWNFKCMAASGVPVGTQTGLYAAWAVPV